MPPRLRNAVPGVLAALVVIAGVSAYFATPLFGPTTVQAETERGFDADVSNIFQPLNTYQYEYVHAHHELPEWIDAIGLGTPEVELGGVTNAYLPRLAAMRITSSAQSAADVLAWAEAVLGALAVLLLARLYGLTWTAAVVAGTTYPLTHVAVRWMPYFTMPVFLAAIPLTILGLELVWQRRRASGVAATVIGLALGGVGGGVLFTQLMVQVAAIVVAYRVIVTRASRRERVDGLVISAVGVLVGLVAGAPGWLPFGLAAAQSTRVATTFALIPGMTWGTLHSIVSPTARSSPLMINGDLYVSIVAPTLVAIGIIRSVRSRLLGIVAVYSAALLLVGLKTPVLRLLIAVVPGWRYVSDVERYIAFLSALPLVLLLGIGLDTLVRRGRRGFAEVAALTLVGAALWMISMHRSGQSVAMVAEIGLPALSVVAATAVWYTKIGSAAAAGLTAVALVALAVTGSAAERSLGWRPVADRPDPQYRPWLGLVARHDDGRGRWMSYCQPLTYTFDPTTTFTYRPDTFLNTPSRWLDTYVSFPRPDFYAFWQRLTRSADTDQEFATWFQGTPDGPSPNLALVNAAGITRVLASSACPAPAFPSWQPLGSTQATPTPRTDTVYANHAAFPEAYISHRWLRVDGRSEALNRLSATGNATFATHVDFVDGKIGRSPGGDPTPVKLERESGSILRATFDSPLANRGLLVVLDLASPGWHASVDGTRADIVRTNGVFRGVVVPKGARSVVLRYRPWWTSTLYPLSWLLVLLALLTLVWRGVVALRANPAAG